VLAVSVLGSGIAALDATVVNIALPAIGRDFGTGVAALQWVMNGYTLTLAAFLLIGGSLGDRFGRRKVYVIGTAWFALASAACGFAPDVVFLIITRVLQGVGAALLTPGSLAILEASFRAAGRRLPHLGCILAVDLLHQHPGRGDGDRAERTARPRIAQPRCGRQN
jgi:MFS family permease